LHHKETGSLAPFIQRKVGESVSSLQGIEIFREEMISDPHEYLLRSIYFPENLSIRGAFF